MKFDTSGLLAGVDALAKVATGEIRPAAQAGAQVLYEEALQRVPVKTGKLRSAIYQVYSQDNSGLTRATYQISWNARKAPHGHLVEFGTSRAAAHPFIRPAFDSAQSEALKAANDRWTAGADGKIRAIR